MHGNRRDRRLPVLALAVATAVSCVGLVATPASAATAAIGGNNLVIDAGTAVRPVTYVGAGGLYALADSSTPPDSVLYPLHLNQLVQPAPGVQQLGNGATVPTGDALKVARSMIDIGAQETVRMPDIYPDFPYKWVSWDDWLSKVDTMVQARLAANTTTNINGWEPWNEPNWTWDTANAGPFLDGWTRTVQEIKKYDTVTPIVGPSYSLWDVDLMKGFLQNAIATNTIPDVISWHELSGYGIVEGDVAAYRALEKQLGIGPLPIEIEEYAEPNEVDSPSDSLHYLAAFERSGVRDAQRAYWFESGTVDGLLYDNQPTSTYWLYKWYGDMTGNILATTASGNEDGVAALDSTRKVLDAVVGGGTGDNTVTVNNLTGFGDTVQVNLQYTPTSGRYHNVSAPTNLWTRTLPVTNGTVTVPIGAQDPGGAYDIVVTPASGPTTTYQQTYEAENATVVNATRLPSPDASNGGYVGRIDNSGDVRNDSFVDFLVNEPVTGDYDFAVRYANGTGADSTQGLAYDGSAFQTLTYPATAGWGQFATVPGPTLHLHQGYNVIRLAKGAPNFAGGNGYAELDSITLKSQTAVPAPITPADAPVATFVTRVEAETSTVSDGQQLTSANASAGGYIGTLNNADSYVDFPVTVPGAGSYKLTVGYANGGNNNGFNQNGTSDAVLALSTNGGAATNITLPVSGQWGGLGGYFPTATTTVTLKAGANTVRLTHLNNQNYAELDYLQVSSPADAVVDGTTTPPTPAGPVIHVTQTTADLTDALTDKADVTLGPVASGGDSINDAVSYQSIDGFGAAFTDTSTYLLSKLPQATRDQVMNAMFSRADGGVGLSFMRVPMGASDFTATPATNPQPYSYDGNGGVADPTLSNFSIAHDEAYTVPILKQAEALNPQMKLFANNWSPPGWMKNNGTMFGTGDNTLRTDSYQSLADYYVKFLKAYAADGVKVWGITPQNEPTISPTTYPSMLFPASDESLFIRNNLAPALAAAGLKTTIIGGDTDGVYPDYFKALLADSTTLSDVGGLGAHCYPGNLYNFGTAGGNDLRTLWPDIPRYLTECSTGPTGIAPENAAMTTLESMFNGVSGVQLWNVALDPAGGPKIGQGCNGCTGLVTIDPTAGTAKFTENFYLLGQFSKFVKPGAVRVGSTDDGSDWSQAFKNTDGSQALVIHNTTTATRTLNVTWNGLGSFSYTLGAHTTATFWTDPTQVAPTLTADAPPATATVGQPYSYTFTAAGYPAPKFSVSSGTLPAGLVLNSTSGELSGSPTTAGSHTFTISAGNGVDPVAVGISHTLTVTAPPISHSLTAASGPTNGWYTGPVTVALSGSAGGQQIQYQIDGGAWKTYSNPFSISTDGTHSVNDRLLSGGLTIPGTEGSFQVKIDKTPPVTTVTRSPSASGTPRNPVSVEFTATDATSGVAEISYQVNNGGWTTIPASQTVTFGVDGSYVIGYQAVDNAGNTAAVKTTTVTVTADPIPQVTAKPKTASGGHYVTFTVAGFHRYTSVALTLGAVSLGSFTTDVKGTGRATLQIPATTHADTYTVTAAEPGNAITATATIRIN